MLDWNLLEKNTGGNPFVLIFEERFLDVVPKQHLLFLKKNVQFTLEICLDCLSISWKIKHTLTIYDPYILTVSIHFR